MSQDFIEFADFFNIRDNYLKINLSCFATILHGIPLQTKFI